MEVNFHKIFPILILLFTFRVEAKEALNLNLTTDPKLDPEINQSILKSYQNCENVFKESSKPLKQFLSAEKTLEYVLTVSKSGKVETVNFPIMGNEEFNYKKWISCLTKHSFLLTFPESAKNRRFIFILRAKPKL